MTDLLLGWGLATIGLVGPISSNPEPAERASAKRYGLYNFKEYAMKKKKKGKGKKC